MPLADGAASLEHRQQTCPRPPGYQYRWRDGALAESISVTARGISVKASPKARADAALFIEYCKMMMP